MNDMRIYIIDPERNAVDSMSVIIRDLLPTAEIKSAPSFTSAEPLFQNGAAPDLCILPLAIRENSGFTFLQQVRVTCPIVFSGRPDDNLSVALRAQDLWFLPKPLESLTAREILTGVILAVANRKGPSVATRVSTLPRKRFLVRQGQKWMSVPVEDVAWFRAESKLCYLRTWGNARYIIDYTLEELGQMLDRDEFFRANRNFILHVKAVRSISPHFGGKLVVELALPFDGEPVMVSKERAQEFRVWLGK